LFETIFYPFGFPLIVRSNDELVLTIAHEEWDPWRQAFDDPPIELEFRINPRPHQPPLPAAEFHANSYGFTIRSSPANIALGKPYRRSALAFLEPRTVANRPYFTYFFLDAMAFQLITSANLTPLHAASVARNGRAIVFTGDSGAGKSSLSYACARRGWTFVSDDASHLLRRCASARRILGVPHSIRLRPDAPNLFPELARFEPKLRGTGKMSLQIPTGELGLTTAPTASVDWIILPRRGAQTRLMPLDKSAIREHCAQWFYHWDAPVLAQQEAAFDEMLDGVDTFSLEYADLDSAVDVLDARFGG